jgi:hypothetical protein
LRIGERAAGGGEDEQDGSGSEKPIGTGPGHYKFSFRAAPNWPRNSYILGKMAPNCGISGEFCCSDAASGRTLRQPTDFVPVFSGENRFACEIFLGLLPGGHGAVPHLAI